MPVSSIFTKSHVISAVDSFAAPSPQEGIEVGTWACGAEWLVVDHYGLDPEWLSGFRRVTPKTKILSLEDEREFPGADLHHQPTGVLGSSRLGGLEYALLRPSFWLQRCSPAVPRTGLLLSLGATGDVVHQVAEVIRFLEGNGYSEELTVLGEGGNGIAGTRFLSGLNAEDMAALFSGVSSAAVSCSNLALEAISCNTPVIVFAWAQNQRPLAECLRRSGINVVDTVESFGASIVGQEARLSTDVIDGLGSWRTAAAMGCQISVPIPAPQSDDRVYIRPVSAGDVSAVWILNTLADYRLQSFSTSVIPWADHLVWWKNRPDRMLLAVVGNIPVGLVRLRGDQVDIVVHSAARGRGVGRQLLQAAIKESGAPLVAHIRNGNEASMRLFRSMGFVETQPKYSNAFTFRLEQVV